MDALKRRFSGQYDDIQEPINDQVHQEAMTGDLARPGEAVVQVGGSAAGGEPVGGPSRSSPLLRRTRCTPQDGLGVSKKQEVDDLFRPGEGEHFG